MFWMQMEVYWLWLDFNVCVFFSWHSQAMPSICLTNFYVFHIEYVRVCAVTDINSQKSKVFITGVYLRWQDQMFLKSVNEASS